MGHIRFPKIYRNRLLDERAVRFYAVLMTADSEGGISIPLAQAITQYVTRGIHDTTYESIDDAIPKETDFNN